MAILKLKRHREEREIAFELRYLGTLTAQERFNMMISKSEEMRRLLNKARGHRTSAQIVKRS